MPEKNPPLRLSASYLEDLLAQRKLFSVEQGVLQLQADLLLTHVGVYRALGGGWTADGPSGLPQRPGPVGDSTLPGMTGGRSRRRARRPRRDAQQGPCHSPTGSFSTSEGEFHDRQSRS